jgi:hypothetical protein
LKRPALATLGFLVFLAAGMGLMLVMYAQGRPRPAG